MNAEHVHSSSLSLTHNVEDYDLLIRIAYIYAIFDPLTIVVF